MAAPWHPKTLAVVVSLQSGLEDLYRLDPAPDITRFLVQARPGRPEELLLVEERELFLGVALAHDYLAGLHHDRLQASNLDAFCLAVEAVSHFLCVMHRVREERSTSIMELELQAEVDKYVAALLLTFRCPSLPSEKLRRRLYDTYELVEHLSGHEQARYHRANQLARRYANKLERRFVRRRQLPSMLQELRRFYRLDCRGKHELIAAG